MRGLMWACWLVCGLVIGGGVLAQSKQGDSPAKTGSPAGGPSTAQAPLPAKPNIVVILAGDLGHADLGCFGQKKLKTPNLDALAAGGIRFTQFYAGGASGAVTRSVLLTGLNGGRAPVAREADATRPLPADMPTLPGTLRAAGYRTACIGRFDLPTATDVAPVRAAGFDLFYGATNDWHAKNPWPEFLVRDGKIEPLPGNQAAAAWRDLQNPAHAHAGGGVAEKRATWAADRIVGEAEQFIQGQKASPFFLLVTLTGPAANPAAPTEPLAAPPGSAEDASLSPAESAFVQRRAELDRQVGRIVSAVNAAGIAERTLVVFTAENGPQPLPGYDPAAYQSTGKMRGGRGDLTEGAIRVPMIASWPGIVPAGAENDRQWYVGDLFATAAELAGVAAPPKLDSDSLVAALRGNVEKDQWKRKSPLYWETTESANVQAVRFGKWKALRSPVGEGGALLLFDMSNDTAEKRDYGVRRPDLARHSHNLLNKHQRPQPTK
jgi:arylsulfatase A-like enzyme